MQGMSHMALRIRVGRDERLRCAVRHGPEVLRRLRRRGHRARGDLRAGAAEGREAFGAFGAAISRGATALNVAFCTDFTCFFEFSRFSEAFRSAVGSGEGAAARHSPEEVSETLRAAVVKLSAGPQRGGRPRFLSELNGNRCIGPHFRAIFA